MKVLARYAPFSVLLFGLLFAGGSFWLFSKQPSRPPSFSEQELGFELPDTNRPSAESSLHPRLRGLESWKRPEGPWRVALQAGHWMAGEAPDELENLRVSTGTSHGSVTEWETNLAIAEETKRILELSGVIVEILPTTIPPNYFADVFVSIHADGNQSAIVSGYKIAAPRNDRTGKAEYLADLLEQEYESATQLRADPNITRTMRGYYAFNWRRYEHSIHPMTTAAIVETGFLTHAGDRRIIVNTPEIPAQGIASGILKFLDLATGTAQTSDTPTETPL